jgi:hypothetical protein
MKYKVEFDMSQAEAALAELRAKIAEVAAALGTALERSAAATRELAEQLAALNKDEK